MKFVSFTMQKPIYKKGNFFADMNSGKARISIGSTQKMGARTNVQKNCSFTPLDCPWRPSDLEQRSGRVIFKFSMKLELIDKNPCDFVELPKFDNKVYFDYGVKTQKRIINAIVNNINPTADIFFFLLHGRRKNEVLSLKWSDLNLKNRTYKIPCQINKAKRDMFYTMSDELYNRLYKRYIKAKKLNLLNTYVFLNPDTNNKFVDLRRSWNTLLKSNNLPKIRLHDIRHLIATYSINYLNLPVEQVSFTLGHTNITTTQKYITTNIKKSKETIENILNSVK